MRGRFGCAVSCRGLRAGRSAMRPFVWGALLMLGVVAFLVTSTRAVRRLDPPATATAAHDPDGEDVIVKSAGRSRVRVSPVPERKPKPNRGDELQLVLERLDIEGDYRFTLDKA